MTMRWPPLPEDREAAAAEEASPLDAGEVPMAPVAVGEVVAGKYRIEGVIGFGGMGIVCAATHLELHAPIAIKFVRPERGVDDRAVTRFLTEARAAAQLRSQHACRVMDCGRLETGVPFIVMEQLVGSDLRALMDTRGPLPLADAVNYALQACEALAEAHSKHIVHRDVKPENLFLTVGPAGAPCIKVLDFGISKQVGPLGRSRSITEPTENMGSPLYMSPEQMIDPAGVDSRTDIWSLGVVLYELITGQPPFSGETTPQLCASVMTTQPLPPREHRAEISEALSRVILRCMEKDRERRFRDVQQLAAALSPVNLHAEPEPRESLGEVSAIPGLPARGVGLRLGVALSVLAAIGLSAYELRRTTTDPGSAPAPSGAPNGSMSVTSPSPEPIPSGSSEPIPSASANASPKSSKRAPAKRPPKPIAEPDPEPSAVPPVSAVPAAPTTPSGDRPSSEVPNGEVLYPEVKPVPELMPPPAPP